MTSVDIRTLTDQNTHISDIHLSNAPSTLLNALFGEAISSTHVSQLLEISTYAYQNGTRLHNYQSHLAKGLLGESDDPNIQGDIDQLSKEEQQQVYHSTLAQLSKTEVFRLDYQCEYPETICKHFLAEGFIEGSLQNAIKFSDQDCLEICFKALEEYPPNPDALLSHLDHSVISVSTINKNSKGKSYKKCRIVF